MSLALLLMLTAMLGHVYFLLRGVWRYRSERASARPVEMLWAVPILALAFWLSTFPVTPPGGWAAPISFVRGGAYLLTADGAPLVDYPGRPGDASLTALSRVFSGSCRRRRGDTVRSWFALSR